MIHTILGAGGPVANALCLELEKKGETVNLVSRREIKTSGKTTWRQGDLLNAASIREAGKGSHVIYLCAGLVYDAKVWEAQWPIVMQNAIDLASENNARLLFFDNVYMYGKVDGPMLESTPYNPVSKKGEVRAKIALLLEDAFKSGRVRASILRAADFYGSESANSFFDMMVLQPLSKGKKPSWLGNPECLHSFSRVEDCARALFLLGQDEKTDQQIWHAPTAPAQKGRLFIEQAAAVYQQKPAFTHINYFMLYLASLGNRQIKGALEMYYQSSHDYVFDSNKFNTCFNFVPQNYPTGIRILSETMYRPGSKS